MNSMDRKMAASANLYLKHTNTGLRGEPGVIWQIRGRGWKTVRRGTLGKSCGLGTTSEKEAGKGAGESI